MSRADAKTASLRGLGERSSEPSLARARSSKSEQQHQHESCCTHHFSGLFYLVLLHGALLAAAGLARKSPTSLAYLCVFVLGHTVAAPGPWQRLFTLPTLILLAATLGCAAAGLALAAEGVESFGQLGWDVAVGLSALLLLGLGLHSRCCSHMDFPKTQMRLSIRVNISSGTSVMERLLIAPFPVAEVVITTVLLATACLTSSRRE